jgi:glycosyltransferase involved in cell wall biosynthesis
LDTIPNGIRIGAPPERIRREGNDFRFVTVGRLVALKNVRMQLEALAQLGATPRRVHLQVIGDGPERQTLQTHARDLGISDRVEFVGFRQDIEALLAQADAFILTSRSEGIPISILEAMRSGLPVIATNVGGVPLLVENGRSGILTASEDVSALAAAMLTFATQPEVAIAMGTAGYNRARQNFSIESMLAAYQRIYDLRLSARAHHT